MGREKLQEEIRFLYGIWYRYFCLCHFLKKNKNGEKNNPFRRCGNEFDGTANFGFLKAIQEAVEKTQGVSL